MILHGNQRAGARNLALHLLNDEDNDHIDVHEVRGCSATDLQGALQEMQAISKATRCKQFMFSLSLSPPKNAKVSTQAFEAAIDRTEEHLKLKGHARAVVFHEKNGRRHAHCVWSRIDPYQLKAVNMAFYKNRLREVSKALFLDHGWKIPPGMIDRESRNPLNFTLADWQRAQRLGDDPRRAKLTMRQCWAISDGKESFTSALETHGYYLARGDRRGFVVVDWRGEVYSLSRTIGVKVKDLKARLGDPKELDSVQDTTLRIDQDLVRRLRSQLADFRKRQRRELLGLRQHRDQMTELHKHQRETLAAQQADNRRREVHKRQKRLRSGFAGLWDRINGRHGRIAERNRHEAYVAARRDQAERDALIWKQLAQAQQLRTQIDAVRTAQSKEATHRKQLVVGHLPKTQRDAFDRRSSPGRPPSRSPHLSF